MKHTGKDQDYELKVRDYTALREENQRLKELLGLSTLPDAKIAAHVIARVN